MAEPLRIIGETTEPQQSWEHFLKRRSALEAEMFLEVCNGCDHCGTRCLAGFGVTRPEWEAVQAFLAGQAAPELERIEAQEKELPWPGAEELDARVRYCRFRDMEKNRCSVYPVRPTICRLFGHTEWLPCPIEAVPSYPDGAAALWNAYRTEKRKPWEGWQEKENNASMSNA